MLNLKTATSNVIVARSKVIAIGHWMGGPEMLCLIKKIALSIYIVSIIFR